MKNLMKFASEAEFYKWAEVHEKAGEDITAYPIMIDDGQTVMCDAFIECKRFSTACKRFAEIFADVEGVNEWLESILDDKALDKYQWGVEDYCGDGFYIYLNISGVYAGRGDYVN